MVGVGCCCFIPFKRKFNGCNKGSSIYIPKGRPDSRTFGFGTYFVSNIDVAAKVTNLAVIKYPDAKVTSLWAKALAQYLHENIKSRKNDIF